LQLPSVAKANGLRQVYGAPKGAPLQSHQGREFWAAVAPSKRNINRATQSPRPALRRP